MFNMSPKTMIPKQVKFKEELVEDPEVTHPGGSKTEVKTVRTDFIRTDVQSRGQGNLKMRSRNSKSQKYNLSDLKLK